MPILKLLCPYCGKDNTEVELDKLDESLLEGDDIRIYLSVWCKNCFKYFPFLIDEDKNWRDYID